MCAMSLIKMKHLGLGHITPPGDESEITPDALYEWPTTQVADLRELRVPNRDQEEAHVTRLYQLMKHEKILNIKVKTLI